MSNMKSVTWTLSNSSKDNWQAAGAWVLYILLGSLIPVYTPTHCPDRKRENLRWIHRHLLQQLGRREPEGRPEYQLLRRKPRRGCDNPTPGETADYYTTQNTAQDNIWPRPPAASP